MRIANLLFVLLLIGCTPQPEPGDTIPAPSMGEGQRVVGIVRIVGSAPLNVQVVLQPETAGAIRLVGPLRAELERLAGIEVAVTGRLEPAPDPMVDRQLVATDYEIVAVDGMPVIVGEVEAVTNGSARIRTREGEVVHLSGAPASFRVGQKVWVQGPHSVAVQSYGTIRP